MHLLHVVESLPERVALYERAIQLAVEEGDLLLFIEEPDALQAIDALVKLRAKPRPEIRLLDVHSLLDRNDDADAERPPLWQHFCDRLDEAIDAAERIRGDSRVAMVLSLDQAFESCESASEVMSIEYEIDRMREERRRILLTSVLRRSLPSSLPTEFFTLHSHWSFGEHVFGSQGDSATSLDEAVQSMTLSAPSFRHRFLATARSHDSAQQASVPRFLDALRQGVLMVDTGYTIRYASPRLARYLGRDRSELIDRSLKACLDGVDYISIRHECEKLARGFDADSPLIVSWRLSPGVYEPRVSTVDPIFSDNQLIGFLLTLARVQTTRGPRAVYQQLSEEERAAADEVAPVVEDDAELDEEELVNDSIQGTQITRREHQIVLLILKGMSNREMADLLKIAEVTVKKHLTSVYRKLRITNRRELVNSFQVPSTRGSTDE